MAVEIERKFLVVGDAWKSAPYTSYRQGYLNCDPERTVRVRLSGASAFLTVKGKTVGASRSEFEYSIPLDDARELLAICHQSLIEKNRREIQHDGLVWEVDEFLGSNQGLVIAEVELESEDQLITLPDWVGKEVTDDPRYYNSHLVDHPFRTWE